MHQPINFTPKSTHHWCRQEAARQRRVPEKNDTKISTIYYALNKPQSALLALQVHALPKEGHSLLSQQSFVWNGDKHT